MVLGAAKLRENKRKQKIPGSPPGPGKLKKKKTLKIAFDGTIFLARINQSKC